MDPEQTVRDILTLLFRLSVNDNSNEREELVWALSGLKQWIDMGGTIPKNIAVDDKSYCVERSRP